jgi:hypothetical protein
MRRRAGVRTALAAALFYGLAGAATGVAQGVPDNLYNDELLRLSPAEQAAKLAQYLGFFCIGTRPFAMGVTKTGPSRGYAYWSLECAGAKTYAIQIAPNGKAVAIDCNDLAANGEGRECYKPF